MIRSPPNRLSTRTLTPSVGFYVAMSNGNKQRAVELTTFMRAIIRSPYGPSDRTGFLLLPKIDGDNYHVRFQPKRYADTDKYGVPPIMNGREAQQAIYDGLEGVCMYWGDPAAGTEGLVCVDIDESDLREDLPETLETKSRPGHYHRIYATDGTVRPYWRRVNGSRTSRVNADCTHTVLPGSIHERTGTTYRVVDDRPIATLSATDLPDALR